MHKSSVKYQWPYTSILTTQTAVRTETYPVLYSSIGNLPLHSLGKLVSIILDNHILSLRVARFAFSNSADAVRFWVLGCCQHNCCDRRALGVVCFFVNRSSKVPCRVSIPVIDKSRCIHSLLSGRWCLCDLHSASLLSCRFLYRSSARGPVPYQQ